MLGVFAGVVLVVALFGEAVCRKGPVSASASRERKPNIVLVLTDDQDVELGSLNFMPKTLRAIRDQGAEFRHAYVTTPMCCPSRSSLLTGMYVHNHHVYTNNDNCSSTQWQTTYETRSFAAYLSNAGYRTGYFGKYLNKYNGSYVPPGWREWGGLIMNSKYYNYTINMNGKKIKHGFDYYKDYYPDLIANDSIAFLRQSKKNTANKPLMLTMSFPAPHGPEDSAPQYSHLFFNITTHQIPSYDYAPNPDKQWILQVTQKMQPIHRKFTDLLMTKRLQTLQSVDAAVHRVVQELDALGELDNTYIIYTSDHGYHLGQFGLIKGKSFPFEFDVRVPFLVRGPGIDPGTIVDDIILNIDLAPTFLDIAGVPTPAHMDGRSVLDLFINPRKRKRGRGLDTFLIESSGRRETPFLDSKKARKLAPLKKNGTLTTISPDSSGAPPISRIHESGEDLTPMSSDDEEDDDEEDIEDVDADLDDLQEDMDLDVNSDEPNATNKSVLRGEENDLLPLNSKDSPATKLERLTNECLALDVQAPCRANDKWYCVKENGRWRKHKCKSTLTQRGPKKCACFMENRRLLKKIPPNGNIHRIRRDADMEQILFARRSRRQSLEHVETVMRDVQRQIQGLKSVNMSNIDISTALNTNKITETAAGCVIMSRGRVNCSTDVYQDRKTWRKSRHQIDNEIYHAKRKLEKLKEIRRHLKHTKPIIEEINEDIPINSTIPSILYPVEHPKRRKNIPSKRIKGRLEVVDVTTAGPPLLHANHHRHHNHPDFSAQNRKRLTTTTPKIHTEESTLPYPNARVPNCFCEPDTQTESLEREREKEIKRRLKDDKLRRKLRKQRKKDQLEKECGSERMNCFHHDKDHWKTAPLWTEGPFCFCMNANNNTYSCVRTINSTHNILYCEFTTGLVTYYNLKLDPYELQNRVDQLKPEEKSFLHDQLMYLMACKGRSCTLSQNVALARNNPAQARFRKRKIMDDNGRGIEDGTSGGRTSSRERGKSRNSTMPFMDILREAAIKRKRRRTATQ